MSDSAAPACVPLPPLTLFLALLLVLFSGQTIANYERGSMLALNRGQTYADMSARRLKGGELCVERMKTQVRGESRRVAVGVSGARGDKIEGERRRGSLSCVPVSGPRFFFFSSAPARRAGRVRGRGKGPGEEMRAWGEKRRAGDVVVAPGHGTPAAFLVRGGPRPRPRSPPFPRLTPKISPCPALEMNTHTCRFGHRAYGTKERYVLFTVISVLFTVISRWKRIFITG